MIYGKKVICMKRINLIVLGIFVMMFSFALPVNAAAFYLDPGTGASHTSKTVSTAHTYEVQFVDAFTQMQDKEEVTVTLTIKYDYYPCSKAFYYTYYYFNVVIEDTHKWLSRVTFDTYVLQIAGKDIVYTSIDALKSPKGWSSSGSINGGIYTYNKLHIWFGVYTTCSISGDIFECEYKTINKGTSNIGWKYYYGSTYLGNFEDVKDFLIYEYL